MDGQAAIQWMVDTIGTAKRSLIRRSDNNLMRLLTRPIAFCKSLSAPFLYTTIAVAVAAVRACLHSCNDDGARQAQC